MRRIALCLAVLALCLAGVVAVATATTRHGSASAHHGSSRASHVAAHKRYPAAGTPVPASGDPFFPTGHAAAGRHHVRACHRHHAARTALTARTAAAGTATAQTAARATSALAIDLLRRLTPDANTVFSPLSIETALAMVDQGASGDTASEIDTLLGGATSPAALAGSNQQLDTALHRAITAEGSGGPVLDSADALWIQSGLSLDGPFKAALAHRFGAPAQQTDFSGNPASAVDTINQWASDRTGGLIPTLMSPAEVTAQTELVLANALYLDARWQSPFNAGQDETASFQTPSGPARATFMDSGQFSSFPYAAGSGYQAVALPYAHSSLQYLAVMAPAGTLAHLEGALTPARLGAIAAALKRRQLELLMPKFSLAAKEELNGTLASLGLADAFSQLAQLNRMVAHQDLQIQAVEHAAVLKVAEKGTVAAAATGISIEPTAVAESPFVLDLDHPFLIFIRDTQTGAVLFAARVDNPSAG